MSEPQAVPELQDMTIEQIEEMFAKGDGFIEEPDETTEPEPVEDEPTEAEPVQEVEAESDDTPEDAPAEAESSESEDEKPEDIPDPVQLAIEEAEARAKHFESIAGRTTGELGYLRKRVKELEQVRVAAPPPAPSEEDYTAEQYADERPKPPTQAPAGNQSSVATYVVGLAVNNAANEFKAQHPDLDELADGVKEYLSSEGGLADVLSMDDPVLAAQEVTKILNAAYWKAKADHTATRRIDAEKRRADQLSALEQRKKSASSTSSGSVPAPKPKPKSYDDMSVEELEAELTRQHKGLQF